MDRSNFYFRQLTTEQNLDNAFDDVERMEQERTMDADTWGVWHGLVVTEQAVPDLTVKVSAGVAHDELGRRIKCPSDQNVDLSGYLPVTPGNTRKIHIYVENADIATDSRIDGNGNPLYYRKAESYQIAVVAGTEANPGLPPAIVADQVLLAEVTLTQGQTTILNTDISISGDRRQLGGIPWRRDRLVVDDLCFDVAGDYSILGPDELAIKSGIPTDTGITGGDRGIIEIGEIIMTPLASSGLGINMQDTPIANISQLHFGTSTPSISSGTSPLPVLTTFDMGSSSILKAKRIESSRPDPAFNEGFLYANPTTGALRDIEKYWACDATHMFPGEQNGKHTHDNTALDSWYMQESALAGLNISGHTFWRHNFAAADGVNTNALFVPIVGVPHGAKLISANVSYSVDGAGMHANHYLRLYLLKKYQGSGALTVDKMGSDPPTNEQNAATGNYDWTENFLAAGSVVDLSLYAYMLAIVNHSAGGATPQEDVILIRSARVLYQIREASGVY